MELDGLFDGSLDTKMDFLSDEKAVKNDGIYRVDLKKAKDKKWRSVVRFLPNVTKDGKIGQSAIEKITHYVAIKEPRELSGWFDSPKNFNERCPLTDLYYSMQNSKNAILIEKSKSLNYSKKYFSYVLVIEDVQQPELVGKILIYQYSKTIKDKISGEKNGEVTGEPCNVFDLEKGKDFVILAKEILTGDVAYPDYRASTFMPNTSSLPIFFKDKGVFKNIPLNENGKIEAANKEKVKAVLLDREFDLESFEAQPLTEEQQTKITEITNFLLGKTSNSFKPTAKPSSDDFSFEDNLAQEAAPVEEDDDDFFADM